jgi:hypothetical protein
VEFMNAIARQNPLVRYMGAIAVAFVASVATAVALTAIAISGRMTSDSSPNLSAAFAVCYNFLIGFNGVFFGALCLRPRERVFGAVGLLVIGICFEILILGSAHGQFHFPRGTITTGFGGLLAVLLRLLRKPSHSRQADCPKVDESKPAL